MAQTGGIFPQLRVKGITVAKKYEGSKADKKADAKSGKSERSLVDRKADRKRT
jgi:hypothetical protein